MIEAVRSWLCSIVMVGILLPAVQGLTPEGPLRRIGTSVGGLVLLAALLRPLTGDRLRLPDWELDASEARILGEGEELGEAGARELARLVSERTAVLIGERAAERGTAVEADVEVRVDDGVPLPWAVTLRGERDGAVEAWIASELGIPPERQTWTGAPPSDAAPEGVP